MTVDPEDVMRREFEKKADAWDAALPADEALAVLEQRRAELELSERVRTVADEYGIENPERPLTEWGLSRFAARDLVQFAIDHVGCPSLDANGDHMTLADRVTYLLEACTEAEES